MGIGYRMIQDIPDADNQVTPSRVHPTGDSDGFCLQAMWDLLHVYG